jgi:formate dehydrogenase iron-sulfur subunit
MTGKRMLIDTSKCQACKACQVACQQWHSLEAEDTTFTGSYQNPPEMSGTNLTVVKFTEIEDAGKVKWLFFKDQCRHCESPPCVPSCPRHAIVKQANGMVRIDPDLCDPHACAPGSGDSVPRPCQSACPYKNDGIRGIPKWKYTKEGALLGSKMRKCDFCFDRWKTKTGLKVPPFVSTEKLPNGQPVVTSAIPACQLTCPAGAITTGGAGKMLKSANSRVSYLKANGYPNANIYPDQIQQISHVIWILTEDKSAYGL